MDLFDKIVKFAKIATDKTMDKTGEMIEVPRLKHPGR